MFPAEYSGNTTMLLFSQSTTATLEESIHIPLGLWNGQTPVLC